MRWIITLDREKMMEDGKSAADVARVSEAITEGLTFMCGGFGDFMQAACVMEVDATGDDTYCETCEVEGQHKCGEHRRDE